MTFVAIIFALLALTSPSFAQECKCSPALKFRGGDVAQYGISTGSPQALKSMSACFWMATPKAYAGAPSILSYAVPGSTNEFLLWFPPNNPELMVALKGSAYRTGVQLADGLLRHGCVTWESSSGDLKVYKDGALVKTMTNIRTGHQISSGGTWVIGQDQDRVGGGFQSKDAFEGILTEVNVWNRVLCPYEISRLAYDCSSFVQGNYKAFSDFDTTSSIESFPSPCCKHDICRRVDDL